MRLVPVQFASTPQADQRQTLELAPPALAVCPLQAGDVANASANRDRLDLRDRANNLELQQTPL
jgi:hypothetical protein